MFERTRVLSRLGQMSQVRYVALALCCAAVGVGARVPAWAIVPQAEVDGAKVYEQRCAACHSGNVPRAPQLNVLRQKSPEDIVALLMVVVPLEAL